MCAGIEIDHVDVGDASDHRILTFRREDRVTEQSGSRSWVAELALPEMSIGSPITLRASGTMSDNVYCVVSSSMSLQKRTRASSGSSTGSTPPVTGGGGRGLGQVDRAEVDAAEGIDHRSAIRRHRARHEDRTA